MATGPRLRIRPRVRLDGAGSAGHPSAADANRAILARQTGRGKILSTGHADARGRAEIVEGRVRSVVTMPTTEPIGFRGEV
jgi:hypothetical protein